MSRLGEQPAVNIAAATAIDFKKSRLENFKLISIPPNKRAHRVKMTGITAVAARQNFILQLIMNDAAMTANTVHALLEVSLSVRVFALKGKFPFLNLVLVADVAINLVRILQLNRVGNIACHVQNKFLCALPLALNRADESGLLVTVRALNHLMI